MRLGKDLDNKPIISVTDGLMLGRAKDVYVDSQLEKLAGLYLGTEGMIRRKAQLIPSTDVVLFGIDVVLVKDNDVITDDKTLEEAAVWKRLKELQGYEVHTPGGTKLGVVGDVILDEAGAIVGLALSRVFVKGPLAEQATVPREAIVETAHEDEVVHVDLAKLEGLAESDEEKVPAEEAVEEEAAEEEPVEELVIEVVEDDGSLEEEAVEETAEETEPEAQPEGEDEELVEAESEAAMEAAPEAGEEEQE